MTGWDRGNMPKHLYCGRCGLAPEPRTNRQILEGSGTAYGLTNGSTSQIPCSGHFRLSSPEVQSVRIRLHSPTADTVSAAVVSNPEHGRRFVVPTIPEGGLL